MRPTRWRQAVMLGALTGATSQFFGSYVIEPLVVRLTRHPVDLSQFANLRGNVFFLLALLALLDVRRLRGGVRLPRLPDEPCGGSVQQIKEDQEELFEERDF